MGNKLLTAQEYYNKYCSTCQFNRCQGPVDRKSNYFLKKCSYYEELMNVEEELFNDLLDIAREKLVVIPPLDVLMKITKGLVEKGWDKAL